MTTKSTDPVALALWWLAMGLAAIIGIGMLLTWSAHMFGVL